MQTLTELRARKDSAEDTERELDAKRLAEIAALLPSL
jgi:hypothetical protein